MHGNKAILKFILAALLVCFATAKDDFDENLYIIKALLAVENARHDEATELYEQLYEKTKNTDYLKEALRLAFFSKNVNFKSILALSQKVLKDDVDVLRIQGANLMSENKLDEAAKIMQELVKKEDVSKNHVMLSAVYSMQNDNKAALGELERAYELDRSVENLLRIVDLLYNKMNDKKEAIRYLESSRRIDGCEVETCTALVDIYAQDGRYSDMIDVYESLFEATKEKIYLEKALGVYVYQKNYDAAIKFLQKYSYNDDALMDLYAATGDFAKAYKKAQDAFDKSFNLEYQAKMAIYKYERDTDKQTKKIDKDSLKQVIANFEKSAVKLNNALYLNYYGYLLIDHDIDAKKGIELVNRALELEPGSVFYIDSLAWGYYKLGECKKADEIMQQVLHDEEFINSPEGKEHIKAIKECLKKGKK
ncbi:tetratricopeptide repeat protein [Campylobacter showae]|uniref:tetratricopeptide repeat protein n=1 Tax=Campylobacter showae TaxID=204 RepID=UPI000F076C0F|nr:hypothetical protein [Campylobacter showae]